MSIFGSITTGDYDAVLSILDADAGQAASQSPEGETPLQLALRLQQFRVARLLIRRISQDNLDEETVRCAIRAAVFSVRLHKPCSKPLALAGSRALDHILKKRRRLQKDGLQMMLAAVNELHLPNPPKRKTIFDLDNIVSVLHQYHAVLSDDLLQEFKAMGISDALLPYYRSVIDEIDDEIDVV